MDLSEEMQAYKSYQLMCQKYLGPPNWFVGEEPPHLTEIFLSNLGRDVNEYDVFKLCRRFGWIYQIRLPVTFADAKGFAYCRFFYKSEASAAIAGLNATQFNGKCIKVTLSMDTRVIQIMDLPKNWPEHCIKKILMIHLKNVSSIKINNTHGFALCTFPSHNEAQINIRELKKNASFGRVQWARGDYDLPEDYFLRVKDLYVGHLPIECTIGELRSAISHIIDVSVIVIKVHHSGYGFIYFSSHEDAENALLCLRASNIVIRGQTVTFNWLKGEFSKKRCGPVMRGSNDRDAEGTARRFKELNDENSGFSAKLENDLSFNRAPGAEWTAVRRCSGLRESQDSGLSSLSRSPDKY